PTTSATPDPTRYVGTYASEVGETVVGVDGQGRLWLDRTPRGVLAEIDEPPYRTELVAWRGDTLWPLQPEGGVHQPVAFLGDDGTGRAAYLHTGRADRRIR
ncbi:serine hydrolase, partial [Pimelobacter simplex]|nr:serine hydrolase [Pimelobacter simplex]